MITNPYFNKGVIISVVVALLFTVLTFFVPQPIEDSVTTYEYETKLFDKEKVSTVDIKIDEATWNQMIENALQEEYVKCDVTINGETYYNVGIRPKGNTSLTEVVNDPDTDRLSFKIEFDHYVKGQTYYGLDKLVLNNNFKDATSMKEYLSYDLMSYLGMVTPLYSYTQINVNGEPWGLYLALEGMEESFATRNFGTNYGELYKPETMGMNGGGMGKVDMPKGEKMGMPNQQGENQKRTNTTDTKTTNNIEQSQVGSEDTRGSKEGMQVSQGDMQAPQGEIQAPPEGMQAPQGEMQIPTEGMEMPEGGMQMPPQGMGGPNGASAKSGGADLVYTDDNVESYSTLFESSVFKTTNQDYERVIKALKQLNEGQDIENYVDVEGVLKYIAANTVLVNLDSYFSNMQHNYYLYEEDGKITMLPWDYNLAFAGFQGGSATSAVNFPIDTPVSGVDLADRPIVGKLLEVDSYKEAYHGYLQDIVDGYFKSGRYEQTIKMIDSLIGNYIKEDPTAFYTYEEYVQAIDVLKQFGIMRASSIDGQLKGTIPSTTKEQQESPQLLIDASTIDLSVMGTQGGGERGGMKGDRPSQMMGTKPTEIENDKTGTTTNSKSEAAEDAISGATMDTKQAGIKEGQSGEAIGNKPVDIVGKNPSQMMGNRPPGMKGENPSSSYDIKSVLVSTITLIIALLGLTVYKKRNIKYRSFYK
nr:CotH kinase family protein [uncultured Niameybacter sp.]